MIKARPFVNTHEVFHIKSNSGHNIVDLGLDIDIEVDLSPLVQFNKNPEDQVEYVFTASIPYLETECHKARPCDWLSIPDYASCAIVFNKLAAR